MADAEQEVTYSDDEFGSDYEAEHDDVESEQQQASSDMNDSLTRVLAAAREDEQGPVESKQTDDPGADESEEHDSASREMQQNDTSATSASLPGVDERIQHLASVSPDETSEISAVPCAEDLPPNEKPVADPPKLLGQLAKPASIRSLSVPVVPAASLVDPSLLVSNNLRSTSVPVVPINEIIGTQRQNSGRFRIETVSGSHARHKSIVRLPSVEEMIGQGDIVEESDEDSDGDSDNDDAADSPPSPLSRGRSASFQKILPPKVSPVLRAKSQPFMMRLPSVIEVTAEEMELLLRDGEGETKSDGDDKEKSEVSNGETNVGPTSDLSTELPAPAAVVVPGASVTANLQIERPSVLTVAEMEAIGQPQMMDEPDDEYEDDYDDQHLSVSSEQVTSERNDAEEHQEILEDDKFKAADDTNPYNDDEYEGDGDAYDDAQLEEDGRRETELLLREAQLLIQKQHETTSDRMALLEGIKRELPDIPDQSEQFDSPVPTKVVPVVSVEATVVEEDLVLPATEPEPTAGVAIISVEDHYGGDDEFTAADDDKNEDELDELDQYASDQNEAEDGAGEDDQEPNSSPAEQRPPEIVVVGQQIPAIETAQSPMNTGNAHMPTSLGTDAQNSTSHLEEHHEKQTLENKSEDSSWAPPTSAPCGSLQEPRPTAENNAFADGTPDIHSLQETKNKPNSVLNTTSAPTVAATQSPTRVITRPSRPTAAVAPSGSSTSRAPRPAQPAAPKRTRVDITESILKRERPRELRLKTQRSGSQSSSTPALSNTSPPLRTARLDPKEHVSQETDTQRTTSQLTHGGNASPPGSPERDARKSPEKVAPYISKVYVEEYEPLPPKAPVFRQKRVTKPRVEDARRKVLLPVKSPPNLRIDLPAMDKTKRNWLFLNMFRHGDDVSKYESFVPQLTSPGLPQSAGRPSRPDSALQQTYATSQAQAITAYGGGRSSRSGRRIVQPPQQDPALRERERNWAPTKPHESAIPAYDSILDKFCATVTSPVIQRQIYQTRHDDLSPQLAYVLEKRVERQWKAGGAAEAFGAASSSYKTDVAHSPSSHMAIDKRSP